MVEHGNVSKDILMQTWFFPLIFKSSRKDLNYALQNNNQWSSGFCKSVYYYESQNIKQKILLL